MKVGMDYRKIFFSLFLILLSWDIRAETQWTEIEHRVLEYTAHPSPITAKAALDVIPKVSVSFSNSAEESKANEAIYAPNPMRVLEQRVLMKERKSVELAFRMRHIADGAFLEDIEIILGKLIRVDPELFLDELQRAEVPFRAMDGLVGNLGDAYVDEMEKQCKEIQLRKQALNRVTKRTLMQIKDQAIKALQEGSAFCSDARNWIGG